MCDKVLYIFHYLLMYPIVPIHGALVSGGFYHQQNMMGLFVSLNLYNGGLRKAYSIVKPLILSCG